VVALAPRAALAAGGLIAHAAPFAWCSAARLFSLRSIAFVIRYGGDDIC